MFVIFCLGASVHPLICGSVISSVVYPIIVTQVSAKIHPFYTNDV